MTAEIRFLVCSLVLLAALGAGAALAHTARNAWYRRKVEKGEMRQDEIPKEANPADMECCGQHEVCEKESLLAAVSRSVEYYDDEELDRFRGFPDDSYTAEEEEEFREILYSMRPQEVAGWVRSLQLRQVALPCGLKDEVFMIVGERRGG